MEKCSVCKEIVKFGDSCACDKRSLHRSILVGDVLEKIKESLT